MSNVVDLFPKPDLVDASSLADREAIFNQVLSYGSPPAQVDPDENIDLILVDLDASSREAILTEVLQSLGHTADVSEHEWVTGPSAQVLTLDDFRGDK